MDDWSQLPMDQLLLDNYFRGAIVGCFMSCLGRSMLWWGVVIMVDDFMHLLGDSPTKQRAVRRRDRLLDMFLWYVVVV